MADNSGDKAYLYSQLMVTQVEYFIWYCNRKFRYEDLDNAIGFLRSHQISEDDVVFGLPDKAKEDWFERNGYISIPEDLQEKVITELAKHQESLQSRV